ncbi:MAG TPA: DUF3995 domain-containing protein [Acidimicrobiales bacterium]
MTTVRRPSSGAAVVALGTAVAFTGVAVLHVAWGQGSTFPYDTRAELHDAVIGRDATPSPASCNAVAAALTAAALLVGRAGTGGGRASRICAGAVATVLGVRAAFGLAGRTDVLVPGSESDRFRRLDRRVFAPLCVTLAAGAASAALAR